MKHSDGMNQSKHKAHACEGCLQHVESDLQELEEDPEMRSKVLLFRDPDYDAATAAAEQEAAMTDDDADYPNVPVEELVDQMNQLELDAELDDESEDGNESEDGGNVPMVR